MSEIDTKPNQPMQLALFHSTKQLNLSEAYESIPKEIAPTDSAITWESDNIALPVEREFSVGGQTFVSEVKPATLRDPKTKQYKTYFPYFRELRLEYALISLASKQWLNVEYKNGEEPSYKLSVSFYQIQKEIVEAINQEEGKDLKPNDCPYNTTSIREGLRILKESSITVYDATGKKAYSFNRIKDIYLEGDKTIIELGTMISSYITRGDWNVADAKSILSSKTYYTIKLKTLLNLKFRYAREGAFYNPSLSLLVNKIGFREYKNKRETLRKMTQLIESLNEVERVNVIPKKEGRKLVGAVFHIFPSKQFVQSMIEANKLNKRVKNALVSDDKEKVLIEPLEHEFASKTEFIQAKSEFDAKMGKVLHARRHYRKK